MKSITLSILIGLAAAVISWLLYAELAPPQKDAWTVHFTVRSGQPASPLHTNELFERYNETISRRFSNQGFAAGVIRINDSSFQVICDKISDTSLAQFLVTANTEIEFRKIYTPGDLPSFFTDVDEAINLNLNQLSTELLKAWRNRQSIYSIMSPLIDDEQKGKTIYSSAIGAILSKDTALFSKLLRIPAVVSRLPADTRFSFGSMHDELKRLNNPDDLYVYATRVSDKEPVLSNADIRDIVVDPSVSDYNALEIFFSREGLAKWKAMAANSENRYVSVLVDGYTVAVPVGSKLITGTTGIKISVSPADAGTLKHRLAYGILPAELKITDTRIERKGWPESRKKWALSIGSFLLGFGAGILIFNLLKNR